MFSISDDHLQHKPDPKSNWEIVVPPVCIEIQSFTCKTSCYITSYQKKLHNLNQYQYNNIHTSPLHCRHGRSLERLHKLHKAIALILLMDLSASWITAHHCWGLNVLLGQTALFVIPKGFNCLHFTPTLLSTGSPLRQNAVWFGLCNQQEKGKKK